MTLNILLLRDWRPDGFGQGVAADKCANGHAPNLLIAVTCIRVGDVDFGLVIYHQHLVSVRKEGTTCFSM